MIIWMTINSAAIAILAGLLYLTIRQVGILLAHVGVVGARQAEWDQGPRVGENLTYYIDRLENLGLVRKGPVLYLFGTDACNVCKQVRNSAIALGNHWAKFADIYFVYDGRQVVASKEGVGVFFCRDDELRQQLGVDSVPYGIMVDAKGIVLGHGLVNAIGHVESLLELVVNNSNGGSDEIETATSTEKLEVSAR